MAKLLQGEELLKRARGLGVDTQGRPINEVAFARQPRADDAELQRRVIEAERSVREFEALDDSIYLSISLLGECDRGNLGECEVNGDAGTDRKQDHFVCLGQGHELAAAPV